MRKPCEGSAMSDLSEGHYKYKAKNKFMKAAAQQAQQPLKGVVKQQCRKPMRAQLATSTRQQALQGWFTRE